MLIQALISIVFGSFLGTITGLIPGIHINLIASILTSISPIILKHTSSTNLLILITSMATTHIFLDIIPTTFLGIPSEDTITTALPAHRLLLEGKAHQAIILTLFSTIISIILISISIPIIIFILPKIQNFLTKHIHIILIMLIMILILREEKKLISLLIFSLSGILGFFTLNLPNINEPLLPLLSGLFGLSSLLLCIKNKTNIPKQEVFQEKIEVKKIKFIFLGCIAGIISAFFPGLGTSQTSVLISSIIKKIESKDFLILNSSINSVNMIVSFIALYSINKSRNGIVVAVSQLIEEFTIIKLMIVISTILATTFLATFLCLKISKSFIKVINKINYCILCTLIILFIIILVLVTSNIFGLLVLITSTSLGILTHLVKVNKHHLMGCLLIPVILYYIL